MATNNAVNTSLSTQTGTGKFVGDQGPTITSPLLVTSIKDTNGVNLFTLTATASAVNYMDVKNNSAGNSPTFTAAGSDTDVSLYLRTQGTGGVNIQGTGTNDSANTGFVGEFVSASVASGSAVSLTSGITNTVTSISLTAGDWVVWGTVENVPGAGTTTTSIYGGINSAASLPATLGSGTGGTYNGFNNNTTAANSAHTISISSNRFLLSGTTTIYLVANSVFSVSTQKAYGFICARRVR